MPGLGYNSTRGGYLGLSYYWAIGRSWDATISGDAYTEKYYGFGAELRGEPSAGHALRGDVLHDQRPDGGRAGAGRRAGQLVSDDIAPKCAASSRG